MFQNSSDNAHVLLVEDSEDDAYFFKRTLQKAGLTCRIRHAANGAEAIDFLQETANANPKELPRIMFLDLKTPILNGFEVLEWLQHQDFKRDLRVIVLSGSEHDTDKVRAAELGASDYVVKPIKAAEAERFLKDVCGDSLGRGERS